MSGEFPKGRFVWFDLMTEDPAGGQDFYTQLIGWGTEVWDGGEEPYTMWKNGETPIGGVTQLPNEAKQDGAPSHWLGYVAVPDTDASVAEAKSLGGSVHVEPMEIPTVGRFAVLADPQGAVFAVFTPAGEAPGHEGPAAQGEVAWHELMAEDYEAAFDFYQKLFGWQKTDTMDMGDAGVYQMYGRGGAPMGGMFNKPAEMPASAWLYYFVVPDVDASAGRIKELGGRILNGPMEVPGGGRIVQAMDPQGAAFALHTPGAEQTG